ncbi:MAG: hypothetical protein ACP5RH_11070 [Leptodesmis sp.]|uniref:hypothetical protein n=1 Tax=Leptodesmis sp. TaxID=3100501 RepID=UPI003D0996D6
MGRSANTVVQRIEGRSLRIFIHHSLEDQYHPLMDDQSLDPTATRTDRKLRS